MNEFDMTMFEKISGDILHDYNYVSKVCYSLFDSLPIYGYIIDRNLIIYDILGGTNPEKTQKAKLMIGENSRLTLEQTNLNLLIKAIDLSIVNKRREKVEFSVVYNNEKSYYSAVMNPFEDNKVMMLLYCIDDNVAYVKSLVDAKLKAEEDAQNKINYFANMSHEIRTPLNAITGFADLLVNEADPMIQKQYTEIIKNNSNMLMTLVNEVLSLSRVESGKTEMVFVKVRMEEFIDELSQIHMGMMPKGVKLKVIQPKENIIFRTDRNRLMEVMFNFLSNAIKHTRKGLITIVMEIKDKKLILSVKDTGEGIPKEKQTLVFERFIKVDEHSSGTGLGLPICDAIVKRLGGKIEYQSEIGKGSTFSVIFPYNEGE
jgi:signal transduction histidine kinase